uniref:Uncharacterized protein n=1 Tax=Fagus sylvatica TaxID=28930 RepID=A0A2N9J130_FAGSY
MSLGTRAFKHPIEQPPQPLDRSSLDLQNPERSSSLEAPRALTRHWSSRLSCPRATTRGRAATISEIVVPGIYSDQDHHQRIDHLLIYRCTEADLSSAAKISLMGSFYAPPRTDEASAVTSTCAHTPSTCPRVPARGWHTPAPGVSPRVRQVSPKSPVIMPRHHATWQEKKKFGEAERGSSTVQSSSSRPLWPRPRS